MTKKCILVTGIGGNVAQGIIRIIRQHFELFKIIGTNIDSFSAGNHLVDGFYQVSYAYKDDYINQIIEIVNKENIDLIIPTTDFEIYYLSKNKNKISAIVAASEANTALIFLNKYKTYEYFQKYKIPFAETTKPSKYSGEFEQFIVKPILGRGSRDIFLNPNDVKKFNDKEYIVQKLYTGQEITTAFYVNKKNELHDTITLKRKLKNGISIETIVTKEFNKNTIPIINSVIQYSNIIGSANMQSIVTKNNEIIPFEINCRISGTNSIRHNFGFQDVIYTIDELLLGKKPKKNKIKMGVAIRIMMDIIYPDVNTPNKCVDNKTNFYIF